MSGVMQRTLALLELLSKQEHGLPLSLLAEQLAIPRSATHRLLVDLTALGYVRQTRERGDYQLTTKLVTLGMTQLRLLGVSDTMQPIIERLAQQTGELARLGVVDVDHLTWMVTAQGAKSGLRYDPDAGTDASLTCTSSGLAWLATLSEADALALAAVDGYAKPGTFGVNAPRTPATFKRLLAETRARGCAITSDSHRPGVASIAVPVVAAKRGTVGVVVISGPSARLTPQHMASLQGPLLAAAAEVAQASAASPLFDRAYSRTVAAEVEHIRAA
jgi:IclR family transcriptional regulator, acetate operon repressor